MVMRRRKRLLGRLERERGRTPKFLVQAREQRLAILNSHGGVRRLGEPLARLFDHLRRDIGCCDRPRGSDNGKGGLGRNPRPGRNV